MRSLLAAAAAGWFLVAALLIGDGSAGHQMVSRIAFVGLGLLALSLANWPRLTERLPRGIR